MTLEPGTHFLYSNPTRPEVYLGTVHNAEFVRLEEVGGTWYNDQYRQHDLSPDIWDLIPLEYLDDLLLQL